jgi:hypothetical protein
MFVALSLWEMLLNTVIVTGNVVGTSEEVPSCHLSNGSYSSTLWSSSTEYYFLIAQEAFGNMGTSGALLQDKDCSSAVPISGYFADRLQPA